MTDYVSQEELGTARSAISKEIKGAVDAYDAAQAAKEPKWVSDWKGYVATELNGIKSELTVFKAEFVPLNASLPSLFSLEELIKKQFSLDYNQYGVLTRQTGDGGGGGGEGRRGARGEQGPPGPRGPEGPQGREGRRGTRGERGRVGRRGPRGEQGRLGREGPRGPQGPPPSTEALRNATRDAQAAETALRGVVTQADQLRSRLDGA
ncbi:hypothetical protein OG562_25845 [Streptomyces sp. NBC_01275]|uniref:hypothetical protein n=1 Tax=Streptomyces sp. NBC_01275 TaxID=2903807 RepID=UPI00225A7B42|nr:hypothetical protein [Streptomyces sp. NBC_01275]MCX4764321.1 hypothetical protein [Streptomyces sp. NBC_01275]